MALSAEQKRRIRKELQRRAQAKAAWKAGGGKSKVSASMKGWAGFDEKNKAAQLAYIKSLNTSGKHSGGSLTKKQQEKWKKTMGTVKTKGAAKGKAKVEAYISKKGANVKRPDPGGKVTKRTGGGKDIAGNKPSPRVTTTTKTGYTDNQKAWYKKHVDAMGKSGKTKKQIRDTLKKKVASGTLA